MSFWRSHLRFYDIVLIYVAVMVTLLVFATFGLPWNW